MDGVGILERDVGEGKVLVVGFDGVEDPEADDAGTREGQRGSGRAVERVLVYSHQDHVVGDVANGHRLVWHSAGEKKQTHEMTTRGRSRRLENGNLAGISMS